MSRQLRIKGSVILVTGAGRGIGRALIDEILRRGGLPIAVDKDILNASELIAAIGDKGDVYRADVCDSAAMSALVKQTIKAFGGIDIVIANAGIERIGPTLDMPQDDFEAVLETNINGVYRTLKPALASVVAREGHIVALASVSALIPFPMGVAYASSKAAIDMMMRSLRMELNGTGATAGTAFLGYVQTEMAERILSEPAITDMIDRLPSKLLGVKPIQDPARVAIKILEGAERRKAHIYAPAILRATSLLQGLYPIFDGVMGRRVMDIHRRINDFRETHSSRN